MRKTESWQELVGTFKYFRAWVQEHVVFLYYTHCLFIYQIWQLAQVVDASASNPLDLGSNPRSHAISILFFIHNSHAGMILRRTILLHHPTIHASSNTRSMAKILKNTYTLVNALAYELAKVNGSTAYWAWFAIKTSNLGLPPPPGLPLLFYLF